MIRFLSQANSADTLKLGFNLSEIGVNLSKFRHQTTDKETGVITYRHNPPEHGITSITCIPDTDKCTIETSAKIIGADYRNGIHLGNLEQYTDAVNGAGLIKVTPEAVHGADVYRIDACQTLEMPQEPKEVIKALQILNVQKGYTFRNHTEGQVITRKAKSRNDRGVFYGKYAELLKSPNKKFVEDNPAVLKTFTPNSFRMEYQIRKLKDIRQVYSTPDTTLGAVLGAGVNPVHTMFQSLSKDYNTIISKFDSMLEGSKGYKMSMLTDMALVEVCNYDLNLIMYQVEKHVKGNPSYYRTKFRKLITQMKAVEERKAGRDGIINELEKKLLEAV